MEAFISRKRQRLSPPSREDQRLRHDHAFNSSPALPSIPPEDSTEFKLAILASLHPSHEQNILLDVLLAHDGCVDAASATLSSAEAQDNVSPGRTRASSSIPYQTSLSHFSTVTSPSTPSSARSIRPLTKKGKTLHLFAPADIASHSPCSIIHNFLPAELADNLLKELLDESRTFDRQKFKLFDHIVESPHTACFYVEDTDEVERQRQGGYLYNGSRLSDVRELTPFMRHIRPLVQTAVNAEIATRIKTHYPNGQKLRFQSPHEWLPNAAFVNCYDGGAESVGYHTDQLSYLGPRPVIGSLSLGVEREFRVKRIAPKDPTASPSTSTSVATSPPPQPFTVDDPDAHGAIAIHLPHNSLLVMHADMQESYKHALHPAPTVVPHPLAGTKRLNVTYRWYREEFGPRYTPRCKCGVGSVLRPKQERRGEGGEQRYFWMCQVGGREGETGCNFFQWAHFDDDGDPEWVRKEKQHEKEDREQLRVESDASIRPET
ncbi:MAG: hypothetical protein M1817_001947 [Caeruleum heppii]|nr:MAG: hypothetical protein M1817_001947 [Caeruleum heppii]